MSELSSEDLKEYEFYLDTPPAGWVFTSLSEISSKITDGTHKTPTYLRDGVRFISIKNIRPFQPINWETYEKYISETEHEELSKRCDPEKDDILFPRIGTLGFAKRIDFDEPVSIFVGLGLIKPLKTAVLPKFLEFYMNTGYIDRLSRKRANGTGRKTLPLEETRRFPFPFAPLNEQRRIVEKIESLFAELDKGEESLEAAKSRAGLYRQSLLKHAFEGHLTAEWRAANPDKLEDPETLLTRIQNERDARYKQALDDWQVELKKWRDEGEEGKKPAKPRKSKDPVEYEADELPDLPKSWTWVSLDQLISGKQRAMQSGPFGSNLKHSEFVEDGVLVLGIDNVKDGFFSMGSQNRISEEKYLELEKYAARPGDLLVTVMASLGRSCVVPNELETAIITKHVYRISMEQDLLNPNFYNYLLQAEWVTRKGMFKNAQGQTRPGLNSSILRALPVPLLSLAEQTEIVSRLEAKLSTLDAFEKQMDEQLARSKALRQSILKRAFAGELVDQDPNDEPASELLERITAEKAEAELAAKRDRKTKPVRKPKNRRPTMTDLIEVLKKEGDWVSASKAAQGLGITDGTSSDDVEAFYRQLKERIEANEIEVERRGDEDWLRLTKVEAT